MTGNALITAVKLVCPGRPFCCVPDTYDGLVMQDGGPKPALEELEAAWAAYVPVKTWRAAEEFMEEFTMQEKAAIALSSHPVLAALRLELSAWQSAVRADDVRVQMGLSALVSEGIITEERKQDILTVE